MPMYATIHFSLPQPTLSTLHCDLLHISNLNIYKNNLLSTKPVVENLFINPNDPIVEISGGDVNSIMKCWQE